MFFAYVPNTVAGNCVACGDATHGMALKDEVKKYFCADCLVAKKDPFKKVKLKPEALSDEKTIPARSIAIQPEWI